MDSLDINGMLSHLYKEWRQQTIHKHKIILEFLGRLETMCVSQSVKILIIIN